MRLPLVDLAATHAELGAELERAVLRVVRSQRFIGGDEVAGFEAEFAAQLGVTEVVAVGNGTDAIELALRAVGIGPGDEVLVPANTFIATAEAVVAAGARPRFVDVDRASGLIDLRSCEQRLSEATRAVVPVHLYGRVAPMDAVHAFAGEYNVDVLEDAAQAHGASLGGSSAGTIGRAGCFSFYPGKNLGALGDAGAVATDDRELAESVRLLRDHGRRGRDEHVRIGVNSRLDALQAAVLRVKLPYLERWTRARRAIASLYRRELPSEFLDWRADDPEGESHHLFPVLLEDRDRLAEHLDRAGIDTGVHYRSALTQTEAFAELADPCPNAEWRAAHQLSLPIHPHLADDDVARLIAAVASFAPEQPGIRHAAVSSR